MMKTSNKLFYIMSSKNKKTFIILVFFLFLTTVFEITALTLILPFLVLSNKLENITKYDFIRNIYDFLELSNPIDFLYLIASLVILFAFLGMLLSIYTNYKIVKFSNGIALECNIQIFKNKIFNHDEELAELRKTIISNPTMLSSSIIQPFLNIISRILLVFILLSVMMYISYFITIILIILFLVIYYLIFKLTKKIIEKNKNIIINSRKTTNDIFINIFRTKNLENTKEKTFSYQKKLYESLLADAFNKVATKLPRYFFMFLIISLLIGFVLFYLNNINMHLSNILFELMIYIVASLKSLPQLQNIYINFMKIKTNEVVLNEVYNELKLKREGKR